MKRVSEIVRQPAQTNKREEDDARTGEPYLTLEQKQEQEQQCQRRQHYWRLLLLRNIFLSSAALLLTRLLVSSHLMHESEGASEMLEKVERASNW